MKAKNVVQWQELNREVSALMDLNSLRDTPIYQDGLRMKWVAVRNQALLVKDCLRDLGVALNAAMRQNGETPVKVFATPHSQAFMQAARGPFGQILKPQNNHVGPVYVQTQILIDCLDQLATSRPGKADGYAFIKAAVMELQQRSVAGTVLIMGSTVVGAPYHGQGRRRYPDKPVFSSSKAARRADWERVLREELDGSDRALVEPPSVAAFKGGKRSRADRERVLREELEEELVQDLLTPRHIAHSADGDRPYRNRAELWAAARSVGPEVF